MSFLSIRSARAGATSPLKLLPGNPITRYSTGAMVMAAPFSRSGHHDTTAPGGRHHPPRAIAVAAAGSVEREGRVLVGEEQRVGLDPDVPALTLQDVVLQRERPLPGEQDREQCDEDAEDRTEEQDGEDERLREHEDEPEADRQSVAIGQLRL